MDPLRRTAEVDPLGGPGNVSEEDESDDELLQAASKAIAARDEVFFKIDDDDSGSDDLELGSNLEAQDKYLCGGTEGIPVRLTSGTFTKQLPEPEIRSYYTRSTDLSRINPKDQAEENPAVRTMGPMWSNVPVAELTDQVKYDLKLIKNRAGLDPKRHYRKGILKEIPELFQIGTVLEHHSRLEEPRRTRRLISRTIAKDLLGDTKAKATIKKRFAELQNQRSSFEVFNPDQKKKRSRHPGSRYKKYMT